MEIFQTITYARVALHDALMCMFYQIRLFYLFYLKGYIAKNATKTFEMTVLTPTD